LGQVTGWVLLTDGDEPRVDVDVKRRGEIAAGDPDQPPADLIAHEVSLAGQKNDQGLHGQRGPRSPLRSVEQAILQAESDVAQTGGVVFATHGHERFTEQPHLERFEKPHPYCRLERERRSVRRAARLSCWYTSPVSS
jgi:hypothetical protein